MHAVLVCRQCCGAISLLLHVSYGVLGFFLHLFCCRCCRGLDTPRSRPRSDTLHMKWSRQYYWKASKARCIQRMIIGFAVFMSAYMLYFDTEHLQPNAWESGEYDVEEDDMPPSVSFGSVSKLPVLRNETVALGKMAKILILIDPGGFHIDLESTSYHDWIRLVLSTWGAELMEGMELAFLHCLKVADEKTWCPPRELDDTQTLLWGFSQAISMRAFSDWLVVVKPTTYVIPSNLNCYLSTMDSSLPYVLGYRVETGKRAFHDLSAGIGISFSALVQLQVNCKLDYEPDLGGENPAEKLASCCRRSGLRLSSATNIEGDEQFHPFGIIHLASKAYSQTIAPYPVTLHLSDVCEARWLHSVISFQSMWAAKSAEQREIDSRVFWADKETQYFADSKTSGTWRDWLVARLPIEPIQHERLFVPQAANRTLVWEYLLKKIVVDKNR